MPSKPENYEYIGGFSGLGDTIYMRPFIKEIARKKDHVFLLNPWYQFFLDLPNVHMVAPREDYRTQMKNVMLHSRDVKWHRKPLDFERNMITFGYNEHDVDTHGNILRTMELQAGLDLPEIHMDLPAYPEARQKLIALLMSHGWDGVQPIIHVKPYTVRKEWLNPARGPGAPYLAEATQFFRKRGYLTVSIVDLEGGSEVIFGDQLGVDIMIDQNLPIEYIIELNRISKACLSGVCFAVPLSLATGTPMFVLYGGQLALNDRDVITDRRLQNQKLFDVYPDQPCYCRNRIHECKKDISNIQERLIQFAEKYNL